MNKGPTVATCTYNLFRHNIEEAEWSVNSNSFSEFLGRLNEHIKQQPRPAAAPATTKTSLAGGKKRPSPVQNYYICEQVAQIDMMAILDCTLATLAGLSDTKNRASVEVFRQALPKEPLLRHVRQPFIVTADSKKICSIDSASPIDPFRLKRNLKGKKVPNEKKNVDAQLLKTRPQAMQCLEETKHYFNYMTQPITPSPVDLTSLMHATTLRTPNIRQIMFLLLCDPHTFYSSLGGQAAKKQRLSEEALEAEEVPGDGRQNTYIKSVYHNIPKKKKIFKTPSIGSISYDAERESIIMSTAKFINWFTSKMATISN
ncbi:MAG: hypothetical protein E6Q06_02105 [Candidatus Moraniibacteriota bacterium]|nr:MAG: hypothetical protein E6Q06_02105 [Candidatus Moranbacteria bacterium]